MEKAAQAWGRGAPDRESSNPALGPGSATTDLRSDLWPQFPPL